MTTTLVFEGENCELSLEFGSVVRVASAVVHRLVKQENARLSSDPQNVLSIEAIKDKVDLLSRLALS